MDRAIHLSTPLGLQNCGATLHHVHYKSEHNPGAWRAEILARYGETTSFNHRIFLRPTSDPLDVDPSHAGTDEIVSSQSGKCAEGEIFFRRTSM